jgi:hypothetical protein
LNILREKEKMMLGLVERFYFIMARLIQTNGPL